MIRINLLPQQSGKKAAVETSSGAGAGSNLTPQAWGGIYAGVAAVTGVALGLTYFATNSTLVEKQKVNSDLTREIEVAMRASAELEQFRAKLQASKDLEATVNELQRARLGPTRVLLEVSHLVSEGGGPTIDPQRLESIRRENPLAGFNPGWDSRRIWIDTFEEEDRECRIKGSGKTNEDVAEFLSRVALSDLFESVTLERTESHLDPETELTFINFEATCKVRY